MRLGKETKFWGDITADMMSEEEQVGDKDYFNVLGSSYNCFSGSKLFAQ